MGQSEVMELLKMEKEPLTVREMSIKLNDKYDKVSKDINKMLKYKEVMYIEMPREEAMVKYHCKRRVRLYYVKKK